MKRTAVLPCWLIAMLAIVARGAAAQNAELFGLITDASEAVLPQASVRVINQATGVRRSTETNGSGAYSLPALQPGTYDVEINKRGFQPMSHTGVALNVAAHVRLNFTLQIGKATESVSVTARNKLVQATETSVGGTIAGQEMRRLPLNGRNYTRLVLLIPGVSDRARSQTNGTISGTGLYSINGQRPQDNNYTLDGVDDNLFRFNSPGASPPLEALQEVRVMTGSSADYGRSVGANVTMVIKSGSRELHGSLYEFLRNDKLDANDFFANRTGSGKIPFQQNQYGFSAGGPAILPHLHRNRDRTFWFANWEGFRLRRGTTLISTVPVMDQRNGDFSRQGIPIFDPLTSQTGAGGASVRQPFEGNRIPASRIDTISRQVLDRLIPLPNREGLSTNYVHSTPQRNDRDIWVLRIDQAIGAKDTLNVRYLNQKVGQLTPQENPNFTTENRFDANNVAASWTRAISSNSVLDARFGYHQAYVPGVTHARNLTRAEFLHATGIRMFETVTAFDTIPVFRVNGQFNIGGSGVATDDHVYQAAGSYGRQFARHSLRLGGGYSKRQYYYNGSTPNHGTATFDTRLTEQTALANSGHSTASFLLGYPSQIDRGQGNSPTNGRQNATHFFVQDDWRVTSRLTINAGLRYEINNPPHDTSDRLGTLWLQNDAISGRPSGMLLWSTTNPLPDPVTGLVNQPARRGPFGRSLQASAYRNFGPRTGVAYQITRRTSIRAGFGIFYNSTFMQELQDKRKFYPYDVWQTFVANTGTLPDLTLRNAGPAYANTTAIGGYALRPENRTPYSMQWNLFVARELGFGTVLEAGYVGSGNRKQIGYGPFNVAVTPGPGIVQPRRLLPEYGDLSWGANFYNSNYNALQIRAQRSFSGGAHFQANYTWSRSMDGQSSLAESKTQNPFNRRADYSRSSWDLRHVFQLSYVWELPFGRAHRFGGNWPPELDSILGGWALEGITRYQTGAPVNILLGQDRANVGSTYQRPDAIRNPNMGPRTPEQWFDTGAFRMPAAFTYGSAGAFIVSSDGRRNWDVSITKHFLIHERGRLEFRTELFNISNSVAMNDPNGTFTSPAFGQVTSATAARQIQLALRYAF